MDEAEDINKIVRTQPEDEIVAWLADRTDRIGHTLSAVPDVVDADLSRRYGSPGNSRAVRIIGGILHSGNEKSRVAFAGWGAEFLLASFENFADLFQRKG
ncbi:hypothetical protein [Rhizobium halophilum]|uniref:hypothetical protein n=1 Tax=Rhizobium halophilum TaxID=2846852 RepID=UPI001EFEA090|nr:hypothetical protein [Rhizobium halophilum]MCF6367482.1 hypothetical protein [Rhizobium halophilum]